jgi:hypothetical protein
MRISEIISLKDQAFSDGGVKYQLTEETGQYL